MTFEIGKGGSGLYYVIIWERLERGRAELRDVLEATTFEKAMRLLWDFFPTATISQRILTTKEQWKAIGLTTDEQREARLRGKKDCEPNPDRGEPDADGPPRD